MNLKRVDLNLMLYFDVLVTHCNVSMAAEAVNITQPAMSNVLKRLRELFDDSILVRTQNGMKPTAFAESIHPQIRESLASFERVMQLQQSFKPGHCNRIFRMMSSDYSEATLLPLVLNRLAVEAPDVSIDILTPSDVSFNDIETGKIDMAINRFSKLPGSFHHSSLWHDSFSCVMHKDHSLNEDYCLDNYMQAKHIWVSKTGMGKGMGVQSRKSVQGRVDEALQELNLHRHFQVYTRHYQSALTFVQQQHLVATLPTMLLDLQKSVLAKDLVVRKLPFTLTPFQLSMIWSPLLHDNSEHRWLRRLIVDCAKQLSSDI